MPQFPNDFGETSAFKNWETATRAKQELKYKNWPPNRKMPTFEQQFGLGFEATIKELLNSTDENTMDKVWFLDSSLELLKDNWDQIIEKYNKKSLYHSLVIEDRLNKNFALIRVSIKCLEKGTPQPGAAVYKVDPELLEKLHVSRRNFNPLLSKMEYPQPVSHWL